ncbi:MAG: carbohydrate kinase [Eubacteriales bacterium]|nr:carbohydrate kinase [Eubacteriales bacterium]
MYDILGLGEVLIDFTPSGINEQGMALYARNPGGSVANMLVMFAKLGGTAAFVGKVGKDAFGDFLEQTLIAGRVNTKGLLRDPQVLTTLAIVTLMPDGDRSFIFYRKPGADIMLREDELPLAQLSDCRIFHFGGVTLTDEPVRTATLAAASFAREAGALISFDCNYRPSLWNGGEEEARKEIPRALPLAHLVKMSEEELVLATGIDDEEKAAESILDLGCGAVLVSMGEKGSRVYTRAVQATVPAYRVNAIDATGSGDAYLGAVLWQLNQMGRPDVKDLNREDWHRLLAFGNAAGGLTATRRGGIPALPTMAEISLLQSS